MRKKQDYKKAFIGLETKNAIKKRATNKKEDKKMTNFTRQIDKKGNYKKRQKQLKKRNQKSTKIRLQSVFCHFL